jgi:hypothetical protein
MELNKKLIHYRKHLLSIDISSKQHESRLGKVLFRFSKLSIPVFGPTVFLIQRVPGSSSGD